MAPAAPKAKPDGEFLMTRVFDAPRDLVYRAWTEPAHLKRWWGPTNFALPRCDLDLRAGGDFTFIMRDPGGNDYGFRGAYREVVPSERLVFVGTLDNEKPGHEIVTTITFEDEAGRTRVTVRQEYYRLSPEGANEGWSQSLDRLAAHLATL